MLSPTVDPEKVFLVKSGALLQRFDPDMNLYVRRITKFKHPIRPLKEFLKSRPQYGSNQAGISRTEKNSPRYIRITDIDEFGLLKSGLGVTAEFVEGKYMLKNNDLLFARSGATVGKAYLHKESQVDYPCFYAGYMIRFQLKESELLPDFVFYYTQLSVYKEWVQAIQRAAGQPNINAEEYKSLLLPIPSYAFQKKIVFQFEEAYNQKRQKETEAQLLLDSINSYLLDALGIKIPEPEPTKKFFYVPFSQVQGDRFDPDFHTPEYERIISSILKVPHRNLGNIISFSGETWDGEAFFDTEFPYIEISEINLKFGEIDNVKPVPKNEAPSRAKMIVRHDDLLVSTTRPSRGAITLVNQSEGEINIASTGFAVLRELKVPANRSYLFNILRHQISLSQMQQRSSGGNYPAINSGELKKILIPLPSPEVQNEIATHVESIRQRAKQLETEAAEIIEKAKAEVERMILGEV